MSFWGDDLDDGWGDSSGVDASGAKVDEHKTANDHVIVLIDARAKMFIKNDDGETPFSLAMQLAHQLLKMKVISSDKNTVGITLFGTEKKAPEDGIHDNVYELQNLDIPSAARIKEIERLTDPDLDPASEFGSLSNAESCPLKGAVWMCSQAFNLNVKHGLDYKRLWVITNDDNPCSEDGGEQQRVVQTVKDAVDTGMEIRLWHLAPSIGAAFDINKFWIRVLAFDPDEYAEPPACSVANFKDTLPAVRNKEVKKRKLSTVPWNISKGNEEMGIPDISFSVQVYSMIYPAKKSTPIYLDSRTNKPVKVVTRLLCEGTGAYLDDLDFQTYLSFGGSRAYLTKEEMASLKSFGTGEPGFTLLGFKDISTVGPELNLKAPYFIYPAEELVQGSTSAFVALMKQMSSKQVCAICTYIRVQNSSPVLVALLPQNEELNEDGTQWMPPGMHVIFLPFADDIRDIKMPTVPPKAEADQVVAAEAVVRALEMANFAPGDLENPSLQKHYAVLQAVALQEADLGWDEEANDATAPQFPPEVMEQIQGVIDNFKSSYGGDVEEEAPTKKRGGGASTSSPKKKAKTAATDTDSIDWTAACHSREIETFTVPMLKAFLKSKKLPVSGKKTRSN
mmetsp:Transcript_27451/g.35435  ORF Transcript_27451/g.35435 Transcript_27451/m.35435 type:complete len:621 (-) Transcript_27451:82-1944(-)